MNLVSRAQRVCFYLFRAVKAHVSTIFLLALITLGFFYRLYGLDANYSFWSDEAHVGLFARSILERGRPVLANGYSTGAYQWLWYWITALSMKVFGVNELAARLPAVIFGSLTIPVVYLLTKEIWGDREGKREGGDWLGILAALLIAFLKIEILWSRQTRPYQALQFFYLLGGYFLLKISNSKSQIPNHKFQRRLFLNFSLFLVSAVLALLMHGLGLVILVVGLGWLFLVWGWRKPLFWLLSGGLLLVVALPFGHPILRTFSGLGRTNNLFYYRVFLTHHYWPLLLLGALGGWRLAREKKYPQLLFFVLALGVQGFLVSFVLGQPFTRYLYPVFGFLVVLAAGGIGYLGKLGGLRSLGYLGYLGGGGLILLLFWGGKLSFWPQKVYSLNADMQEIPEVDWKRIYQAVAQRKKPGTVLVANWNDVPLWYLGEGSLDYLLRIPPRNFRGEVLDSDPLSGAKVISSLEGFKKIIVQHPSGVLVLDSWDNWVSDSVREFAHQSLKMILEVDRLYPQQARLWSVWVFEWHR